MLRLAAVAVAVPLAGCGIYQPGSFRSPMVSFDGQRATVGCLDVAVARRADPRAAAVVQYQFANRCDAPTLIDLAAVAVVGRTRSGNEIALTPADPNGEIRPLSLDGRLVGQEALAYVSDEPLVQVCVDLASLGRVTPSQWACFASEPELAPAADAIAAVEAP